MVRTCTLSFLFFTLISFSAQAETFPAIPPIPEESPDKAETIMIVVEKEHAAAFSQKIRKTYPNVHIRRTFKKVFSGFTLAGKHKDLEALQKEPHVVHASPVTAYHVDLEESVPFIGGDEVRGKFDAQHERLTGKGVKVGIIDTGIDYTHPDLSRSYHGGADLIDGDSDPMETKATDGTETLHGTHVAGIIAANGKLQGVAPEAEIIAYRALGPGGFGTSEQVIAAIERAIEDKVDVLNLSLGNTVNGPDWPTSLALDRAVEHGIVAVTSSGNSGPGVWTIGSPGTSSKSISVGASTPPQKIPYLKLSGAGKMVPITALAGSKEWKLSQGEEIVFAGIGEEHQYKADMKGKIVLVERGKITFTEKALFAEKVGAKAIIIYNNMKGNFAGNLELEVGIPVVSISKEDGLWLKKQLNNNALVRTVYQHESDQLADFSSRGPVTYSWEIKPDVVAPGVAIDSTVPEGYLSLQGTSMSAPHVAGASALLKQAHPDWNPEQIKAALMNSAEPLKNKNGNYYKPIEQGAGRIDLARALETDFLLYPGSLSFGQVPLHGDRIQKKVKLTLDNQSDEKKAYTFIYPSYTKGLQWKVPQKAEVEPKQQKDVFITLDIYSNGMEAGLHHGWIEVEAGGRIEKIPYLYVVDEPDYPRVMGFEFGFGDTAGTYKYEFYLPGGADEMGIALYDPDTLRFEGFLDWGRNLQRGVVRKTFKKDDLKLKDGLYKAVIFARKGSKEDTIETDFILEDPGEKSAENQM
ncbi:S8 family serine peptidase [Metabacillus idriensis]|uniref:S8 family serine peptidase n=1 Tax=Metabacillus idriensis TaxID=324768 RepID=UPI0029660E26|nr:S8 family serine peptidase [Metabacillus idriensis]